MSLPLTDGSLLTQSAMLLFEQGNYAEFTIGTLAPDVSGVEVSPYLGDASSGSMLDNYTVFNGGVKFGIAEGFTGAVILDYWGIIKADIGIRDGRIVAIGKAGNPDIMTGVHPDLVVGPSTEIIAL